MELHLYELDNAGTFTHNVLEANDFEWVGNGWSSESLGVSCNLGVKIFDGEDGNSVRLTSITPIGNARLLLMDSLKPDPEDCPTVVSCCVCRDWQHCSDTSGCCSGERLFNEILYV